MERMTIMRVLPEVHHLSFHLCTAVPAQRVLEILSQCSKAHYFREVTYGLWLLNGHEIEEASAVVTSWANQKSAVRGTLNTFRTFP